eukprot:9101433-Heterocapsa_arctica.AAC.1
MQEALEEVERLATAAGQCGADDNPRRKATRERACRTAQDFLDETSGKHAQAAHDLEQSALALIEA